MLARFLFVFSVFAVLTLTAINAFADFGQNPKAFGNFVTLGTNSLGTGGTAFHAMGVCTVGSTTLSTTVADLTCTGVPASAAAVVHCNGAAAFSTSTGNALYCRATGTASQVECNTAIANTTAMTYSCSWVLP